MYRTANITFLLWVSLPFEANLQQRSRFNFSKFVLLKNSIFFYETFDQQGGNVDFTLRCEPFALL